MEEAEERSQRKSTNRMNKRRGTALLELDLWCVESLLTV